MWTDSHAHLAGLEEQALRTALQEAGRANVTAIINTATDIASCRTVLGQSARSPTMMSAVGISPFDTVNLPDAWIAELSELAANPLTAAIGEIGLDTTNPTYPDISVQLPVLEALLELAHSSGLPAVVHSRGCERRVAELCLSHGLRSVVFHCYTGDTASLRLILDSGYFVSFAGIITFKNNPLLDAVAFTPLDRVLIETDTPYLAPVPHRGVPNQPAWVPLVGRRLAEIKGVGVDIVEDATASNFKSIFGSRPPAGAHSAPGK